MDFEKQAVLCLCIARSIMFVYKLLLPPSPHDDCDCEYQGHLQGSSGSSLASHDSLSDGKKQTDRLKSVESDRHMRTEVVQLSRT